MIASVPYVPPDTMKNVAATSGQSVIFATLFFVEGRTWEGICAGRDTVLNFYSRPPKVTLALIFAEQAHFLKNTSSAPACKKKMSLRENFLATEAYTGVQEVLYAVRKFWLRTDLRR